MRIREAKVEDLSNLERSAAAFYASSQFLGPFDLNKFVAVWTQILEINGGVIFLCETDRIVGALGGITHLGIYNHEFIAEEFFWFVEPEFRGQGLALYERFHTWAIARGANEIQMCHLLDCMPDKLQLFYLRWGYRAVETRYSLRLTAC